MANGTPGGPGAEWDTTNMAKYGGSKTANMDEDQVAVVVANLKMNQ